jgi:hypothetical protein
VGSALKNATQRTCLLLMCSLILAGKNSATDCSVCVSIYRYPCLLNHVAHMKTCGEDYSGFGLREGLIVGCYLNS